MTLAVALAEAAIFEGKQRLYTMSCERDGVAAHLLCNPQGGLVAAAGVLGPALIVMHRIAHSEDRTPEAAAGA